MSSYNNREQPTSSNDSLPQISSDDLAYHWHVLRTYEEAAVVKASWFSYLAVKYQLQPNQIINVQGKVIVIPDKK
jgi:hypothetical protein